MEEKLQEVLEISRINEGGCGFVAMAVYKYLERQGRNVKLYAINFLHKFKVKEITILNFSKSGFSHIVCAEKIDGEEIIYNDDERTKDKRIISPEVLGIVLQKKYMWNDAFKRKEHVPTIERIFDVKL